MNISLENLDVDIYGVNKKKTTDHYTFLENCPPTPPLSHLTQNVGLGEG